jgi:UDP-N-acetylmuramoyl-tripeptide--D-alanyl-D-alanine ligase
MAGVAGQPVAASDRDIVFSSVVVDSRLAVSGSLFIALRGEHTDGHLFVAEAFARGAVVAIVSRPVDGCESCWHANSVMRGELGLPLCVVASDPLLALQRAAAVVRRRHRLCRVVGVTGSVGKTTTKEAIASVLAQKYVTLKSEGNYNNEIGLPLTLLSLEETTERAVVEMAMYDIGEIALLADIARPDVGVVTNVGPTHLERLGTMERIVQAKTELVEALPPDGVAVLNGDDPWVRAMATHTSAGRVLLYGLGPDVDVRATNVVAHGLDGMEFTLAYDGRSVKAKTALLGLHSVQTALAAAAVGVVEELSADEILGGLADPAARVRLRPLKGVNGSLILDDTYNSSPASAIAALDFAAGLPGRKIAVLGDMLELGAYETEGHIRVGRRVVQTATLLFTVGSLGRKIGEAALEGGMAPQSVCMVECKDEVVRRLQDVLNSGDVVLVKGSRGMAMETVVKELLEEGPR